MSKRYDLAMLSFEIEDISPSDYRTALDRSRPYDGQPQTDTGERGKQEVHGITFRDLRDCFIIGAFKAAGEQFGFDESAYGSIYEIRWDDLDPMAVFQNMSCEVEKRMGIYPNVTLLESGGSDE